MPVRSRLGDILIRSKLITPEQLNEALQEQKVKGGYLGQILIDKGYLTALDVARAMDQISAEVKQKDELGSLLIKDGLIISAQLKEAQNKQVMTKQSLSKTLVDLGFISPEDMARALGKYLDVPYVNLSNLEIGQDVIRLIPENIIKRYQVIPVELKSNILTIAMADPLNLLAIDEIKLITNYTVKTVIVTEKDINLTIEKYYSIQEMTRRALAGMRREEAAEVKGAIPEALKKIEEGPVISLVDSIVTGAINAKASDIHLEPQEPEMRVRYRVDGILHDVMTIPRAIEGSALSRIKVLADMDITERRMPQDGHISFNLPNKSYDLRVSTFATIGGEKIVIRILDKSSVRIGLVEIGLSKRDEGTINSLLTRPYGILLLTGPTGSGKTTSLYAMLQCFDSSAKNIMTIEDPVEYRLDGINQTPINPQAGVTFATGLRTILRQDPDVIMVGEIRDVETAEIAIQSALTGHLVLSTLHTNDAPSAMTRLIDMGIKPFLIVSSVVGVVAQRLLRTICTDCKELYEPSAKVLQELGLPADKKYTFAKGAGCQYCLHTGYRGRTAAFEIMKITDRVRDLVINREPANKIKEVAVREGMRTLRQASIEKILEKVTTPEEAKRVVFAEEL